jgi:hypothetical protein
MRPAILDRPMMEIRAETGGYTTPVPENGTSVPFDRE